MKTVKRLMTMGGLAALLCLGAGVSLAQQEGGGGGDAGGGPPGGGGGFRGGGFGGPGGNFDPAEMQRMMMDNIKEQLEVKDDAEWKVLEAQVQKVMDARREANTGGFGGGGMFGRRGGRNGDNGGRAGGGQDNGPGGGRRGGAGGMFGPQANPDMDALRKAIDSNASADELKAAVVKVTESRKQKQAALERTQADLRKLLSVRQEAIAISMGLL